MYDRRATPQPSKSLSITIAVDHMKKLSDEELRAELTRLEENLKRARADRGSGFGGRAYAMRKEAIDFALAHRDACSSEMRRRGLQ